MLSTEPMASEQASHAPLRASDLNLETIAVASVFTTMDAVSGMFGLRDFIDEYQVPEVRSFRYSRSP